MGRGLTLLISNRTANTWPCMEDVYLVEGGAVVHVGIRDIIVNVERRRTALTTIVSVSPTQADTITGTKDHTLGRKTSAKVIKKSDVKKSKSYFYALGGYFFFGRRPPKAVSEGCELRSLGACGYAAGALYTL